MIEYQPDFTVRVFIKAYQAGEEKLCAEARGIDMPSGYYFGFSAATGDLADNHEILSFTVRNLDGATGPEAETLSPETVQKSINKIHHESNIVRDQLWRIQQRVEDLFEESATRGGGMDDGTVQRVAQFEERFNLLNNRMENLERYMGDVKQVVDALSVQSSRSSERMFSELGSSGGGWTSTFTFLLALISALLLAVREYAIFQERKRKSF